MLLVDRSKLRLRPEAQMKSVISDGSDDADKSANMPEKIWVGIVEDVPCSAGTDRSGD